MIYLGSDIKDIYVGSEKIVKGYVGSELVYEYFHVLPGAGSVLYSDLTFTLSNEDIDTTKTPIGVIYLFKNTNTFRAISINDANGGSTIQWTAAASASISCATNGAIDGKTATATIINTININYGAASNCLRYSNGNTNVGDWFMPSMYELKNYVAVDAVKSSLNKFGPPSWYDEYIWTTDQHSSKTNYARVYNFYNGGTSTVTKNSKKYAVPCLDLTGYTLKYLGKSIPANCLCFTAEADSSSVTLNQNGTPTISKNLYYSLTGRDKNAYTCGTTISLSKGDKLYMWSDDTNALTESESIYKQFAVAGEISVSGDIMTLVNGGDATMKYDFTNLLRNCSAITSFDTSTWDLSKVSNMKWALQTCSGLTTLDTSTWKFTNLESICATFEHCTKLTTLTGCENWKFTNLTNIAWAFNDCPALTTMDTSNWDLSKVTDMTAAFWNCGYLTPIDTSNWDLSNVIWMNNAFRDCGSLKSLNTTNWKLTKVDAMNACFMNNWSLTSLEGSGNWDMSNVTQLNGTFWNCTSLTSLDCSGWNMPKVWDLGNTFTQCGNLTNLILGNGWGKWNQSWTITLRLSDVGKWQNYQLTDATYNSILNMYDRKSNGLGDAILQFSPSHNIPDGFVDKMTAKGYTITLAD